METVCDEEESGLRQEHQILISSSASEPSSINQRWRRRVVVPGLLTSAAFAVAVGLHRYATSSRHAASSSQHLMSQTVKEYTASSSRATALGTGMQIGQAMPEDSIMASNSPSSGASSGSQISLEPSTAMDAAASTPDGISSSEWNTFSSGFRAGYRAAMLAARKNTEGGGSLYQGQHDDSEMQSSMASQRDDTSAVQETTDSGVGPQSLSGEVLAPTKNSADDPRKQLFCFAIMMPGSYEVALLKSLLRRGLSLFACDEYSVFSDGDIALSPGPPARVATEDVGSVKCSYGGPFNLALNSEIFVRVWRRVFSDGKYDRTKWTTKVDPDAVFLPQRLIHQAAKYDYTAEIYLNNCDQGLHGPIEVISHGGMAAFKDGIDRCVEALKHEWSETGEDVFLRHCLGTLKVNRVDNFKLLSEDRCMWENPAQDGCTSGKVAFHPFKDKDSWLACYKQAMNENGTHIVYHKPQQLRGAPNDKKCAMVGQNCKQSRCCVDQSLTCRAVNEWWVGCLPPKQDIGAPPAADTA